jgi:hypothetical protein
MKTIRAFVGPDGTPWGVRVKVPSHSSAMVVFMHPDGETSRRDRYAWYNANLPEANDPVARLTPSEVAERLDDRTLQRLFRRSMPVQTEWPSYNRA